MNDDQKHIIRQFQVPGNVADVQPFGTGHINDTYKVRMASNGTSVSYILQRINHAVFQDPAALMDNVIRVTEHICRRIGQDNPALADRQLRVIRTRDHAGYYQCPNGRYWRMYNRIEGAVTYDVMSSADQAFEAARMYGAFQKMLSDFPGEVLHETIPDFHHTPKRFKSFLQVLDKDPCNRAAQAKAEIKFVSDQAHICSLLIDLWEKGDIPLRVTHNDTKINNVMFDQTTGKGVCVIDLDTVMPGLSLYDVGDMVRTATCPAAEDERDLSKVSLDISLFESIARGFAAEAKSYFTPVEKKYLAFAGKLITFEQMIRFLGDYLDGDRYYKTSRPDHNLDRARTQMKLIGSMIQQQEQMDRITEAVWQDAPRPVGSRRSQQCTS